MKRGNAELLGDIKEAIKRIESYTKGISYQTFLKDTQLQDAVIRNLEIIGEAVKGIPAEFKSQHKQIEWKQIAAFRDKIIHHYFGVNWDIVWDVLEKKLPELKGQIQALLKNGSK